MLVLCMLGQVHALLLLLLFQIHSRILRANTTWALSKSWECTCSSETRGKRGLALPCGTLSRTTAPQSVPAPALPLLEPAAEAMHVLSESSAVCCAMVSQAM